MKTVAAPSIPATLEEGHCDVAGTHTVVVDDARDQVRQHHVAGRIEVGWQPAGEEANGPAMDSDLMWRPDSRIFSQLAVRRTRTAVGGR
jgi:NADPH-dependent ferric siderophore reductase